MNDTELGHKASPRQARKRVGRGNGSGTGRTAGRGHKGQKARSGGKVRIGFEGGQMPLYRRFPKFGFNNKNFATTYVTLNVQDLVRFGDGAEITPESVREAGLIKNLRDGLKILGEGEVPKNLTITAHRFTASARQKIEAAGGTCTELRPRPDPADVPKRHGAKARLIAARDARIAARDSATAAPAGKRAPASRTD